MQFIDVGGDAVGFIAIGQNATGIIALGQLATGVIAIGQLSTGIIAIGQLARGVFVVGQVAIGVAAFGQLVVALTYGGGMVGVAGVRATPSLVIWGVCGHGRLLRNRRIDPMFVARPTTHQRKGLLTVLRVVTMAAIVIAVALIALRWIPGYITDDLDTPPEPPPPTYAPGTR